jgi:Fe-S-cluster containining protein
MDRTSSFSYRCGCCGRCCRNKVITLAPYDVMRLASASGLSTVQMIARFTLRRGSLLRFDANGGCVAIRGGLCAVHAGRPLPCRLYPLGMERTPAGDRFTPLEAASGSIGVYGADGSVGDFLEQQGVPPYLGAVERYATLIAPMRARIGRLADFEKIEPAEFRRVAIREALAETSYDYNRLIEALFDSDPLSGFVVDRIRSVEHHVATMAGLIEAEKDATQVAAAAVLLAVSIGYTPGVVFEAGAQGMMGRVECGV